MGIYKISVKELVEVMASGLDSIEGDFSTQDLNKALEKLKMYPYTSNSRRSEEIWVTYLCEPFHSLQGEKSLQNQRVGGCRTPS